jgi:hypothetical protein
LIQLTPDLRLLLAPTSTYRHIADLASAELRSSFWPLVARILSAPAIAGVATGVSAAGEVSWTLAFSGIVCWSFLCAVQVLTAVILLGREGRAIGFPRALRLFFLGHAAWSLWLIAAAVYMYSTSDATRRDDLVLVSVLVPMLWTAVVGFSYCREVLRLDVNRALARVIVHQSLTVFVMVAYLAWAIQLLPRLFAPSLR